VAANNSPHAIAYATLLATMQILNEENARNVLERRLFGELAVYISLYFIGRSTIFACANRSRVWIPR
jgi:hypothetical protein